MISNFLKYSVYCLKELVLYQYYLIEFIKVYTRIQKKRNRHLPRCEPTKYTTQWNPWPLFVENCSAHYVLQLCHKTEDFQ